MIGETKNYFHKILSVRAHWFLWGGLGYIVEGVSQKKVCDDFEWCQDDYVYYYIAQTDDQFKILHGECMQRRPDYQLDNQGLRYDVPIFLSIPLEVQEFIYELKKAHQQFMVRTAGRRNKENY